MSSDADTAESKVQEHAERKRSLPLGPQLAAEAGKAWTAFDPDAQRTALAGPLSVQIQTVTGCNGRCVMCPMTERDGRPGAQTMDESLYMRILEQLAGAGTVRILSPMLQCEPLLDPRLATRVRQARQILGPQVAIWVTTNGALLTPARADELADADVNVVEVSLDAVSQETYSAIRQQLDFAKIVANVEAALARPGRMQVALRFTRQQANAAEEARFLKEWSGRGALVVKMGVTNRCGSISSFSRLTPPGATSGEYPAESIKRASLRGCLFPFTRLHVLHDGQALFCCEDWREQRIVGHLGQQPLEEVWNGAALNRLRGLIQAGAAGDFEPCRSCSRRPPTDLPASTPQSTDGAAKQR
jgi:hypothetical protein